MRVLAGAGSSGVVEGLSWNGPMWTDHGLGI